MGTGACGIDCNACRLRLRGLCMGCGSGTGRTARKKLEAQQRLFGQCCPVLQCAREQHIGVCLRDCRKFPCRVFRQGPAPLSGAFLRVQEQVRATVRPPSPDLARMSDWQADEIAPETWQRLIYSHPSSVCRRTLAVFHREEEAYEVRFLGRDYNIYPFRRTLERKKRGSNGSAFRHGDVPLGEALILLHYLLEAEDVPISGRWITERELPGGVTFFQGSRRLPLQPVLDRYAADPAGFVKAGRRLGGRDLCMGDAAVGLRVLPRVPLRYILWQRDEEFPPHATVAFDASAGRHLPLVMIWALVHTVSNRLAAA